MSERETLHIAAVADIHMKKSAQGTLQPLFAPGERRRLDPHRRRGDDARVAMPVLAAAFPDRPPLRVVEVPLTAEAVA